MAKGSGAGDDYGAVPYLSLPYPLTHPDHLAVLARLHGLPAADPRAARILEIGCAGGANLVPIAWYRPDCQCIGFEPEPAQAAGAAALAAHLALANCRIVAAPAEVTSAAALGPFDYIVCHGVYSWVDARARAALLATVAATLAPDGVACISYNTRPGWRMRGMLRDMLGYHLEGIEAPAERLAAARELLAWLVEHQQGSSAAAASYLREECAQLASMHDSYLYHEYLCPLNEAFLYSEFRAACQEHGLHAVCDADLEPRHAPPLPETAGAALDAIPERDEQEQYLDFLLNRNYRETLVARRAGQPPDWERLTGRAVCANLAPPRKLALDRARAAPYRTHDGTTVQVTQPLTKAALALLAACYPAALPLAELAARARDALARQRIGCAGDAETHLFAELVGLFVRRAVRFLPAADDPRPASGSGLHALARAQLAAGWEHLVGPRHVALPVDAGNRARWLALAAGGRAAAHCDDLLARARALGLAG